jgi:hypothetical protein
MKWGDVFAVLAYVFHIPLYKLARRLQHNMAWQLKNKVTPVQPIYPEGHFYAGSVDSDNENGVIVGFSLCHSIDEFDLKFLLSR